MQDVVKRSARLVVEHYLGMCVSSDFLIKESLTGWLFENRIQKLISQTKDIKTSHDPSAQYKEPKDVINHLAQRFDPSEGKVHTEHLLKWYQDGHFSQEDHESIRTLLKRYDKHKDKLPFTPQEFNSPKELRDSLDSHIGKEYQPTFSKEVLRPSHIEAIQKGSKEIRNDEDYEVRELRSSARFDPFQKFTSEKERKDFHEDIASRDIDSRKAMQILGSNTSWCIIPEKEDDLDREEQHHNIRFEEYSQGGPLYWIHDKKNNQRFAVHPALAQVKDINNDDVPLEDMPNYVQDFYHKTQKDVISDGKTNRAFKVFIATDHEAHPDNLHELSKLNDSEVNYHLSENSASDDRTLHRLAQNTHIDIYDEGGELNLRDLRGFAIHRNIINRENVSSDTLHHLAQVHANLDNTKKVLPIGGPYEGYPTEVMLKRIACNDKATEHTHNLILEHFKNRKSRGNLHLATLLSDMSKNNNLSINTIKHAHKLLMQPDSVLDNKIFYDAHTFANLAGHKNNNDPELLREMYKHSKTYKNTRPIHSVISNPYTPTDVLEHALKSRKISYHPSIGGRIRLSIARHQNATGKILHALGDDLDPEVRRAAREHQNYGSWSPKTKPL